MKCECGKTHTAPINEIVIENGAIERLPAILRNGGFKNIFLVSDINTHKIIGDSIISRLQHEFCIKGYVYEEKHLIPDELSLGKLFISLAKETEIIVGAGSGTINDICRYASWKLSIPYIIVATAPSMDGYASSVSPLIVNGLKTTFEAVTPYAIIGDTQIMKNAPLEMIAAGVGDIIGKYTALCDWKISNIVTKEYYCEKVMENTKCSVEKCVSQAPLLTQRSESAIQALMESLVMSGISMSYVGNSRPASGAEHHIAHFWEMIYLFQKRIPMLHGTKVGVASIIVAEFYHKLLNASIDFEKARNNIKDFDYDIWSNKISDVYKSASMDIIKNKEIFSRNEKCAVLERINSYESNWDEIKSIIEKFVPIPSTIVETLSVTGALVNPTEMGIDAVNVVNGLIYSREARPRFTMMQILQDLGLLEIFAEEYCQHNNEHWR